MVELKWRGKSFFTVIMAVIIVLTQPPIPVSAANGFLDVPNGAWFEKAVSSLAEQGIIKGVGNSRYAPDWTLSRAEAVTILGNMVLTSTDIEQYKNFTRFKDVPKNEWYTAYVNWASEAGIVDGYGGGIFKPGKAIARQELAVILRNFSQKMGYKFSTSVDEKTFADQNKIDDWASGAVKSCQRGNVFVGDERGCFNPKQSATRAEAAVTFYKYIQATNTSAYQMIRKRIAGVYVTGVSFDATQYNGGISMGNDKVKGAENMSSMVERTGAKFAVNAAFFDMSNYNPNGTIIDNGRPITMLESYAPYKSSFNLNTSGNPSIENFRTIQKLTLERNGSVISSLEDSTTNRSPSSSSDASRILYDRFWGSSVGIYARDVIAIDSSGYVVNKASYVNDMAIPSGGEVLYQRARREYEGTFFDSAHVGDKINRNLSHIGSTVNDIDLSIAAGPRIVKGGGIYGNATTYKQEGLGASDIVSGSARRVAIGVNGNKVIIITASNCTMAKLSEIMLGAGCADAMNLDGGASSGLYVDGTYLATPGRKLNNMIYFK